MPENSIQHLPHKELQYFRKYSFESMEWIYYIGSETNVLIEQAENGGEKCFFKYHVDANIPSNNTVMEYLGCYYHG